MNRDYPGAPASEEWRAEPAGSFSLPGVTVLRTTCALFAVALLAAACGDSSGPTVTAAPTTVTAPAGSTAPTSSTSTTTTTTAAAPSVVVVAAGTLDLPAAAEFGDPGFHEPLFVEGTIPEAAAAGGRLIVSLRDAERPDQACDSEHPLSGCATVDWSDAETRPNVPSGGVFDNSLTIVTADETLTAYLSESGDLAAEPDAFDPG